MSREIKFRGNSLVTKEQAFGHLFYFDDGRYFISPKGTVVEGDEGEYPSEYYLRGVKCIEVEPETVSQYTGSKDMNGVEIYEGDILYFKPHETHSNDRVVEYIDGSYHGRLIRNGYSKLLAECVYETRVIGNIYENPELLKEDN